MTGNPLFWSKLLDLLIELSRPFEIAVRFSTNMDLSLYAKVIKAGSCGPAFKF